MFIHTLSGYYSRIGAFTHYIDDSVLQDRIYLDSNWLVDTVYEVLDNPIVKERKGRISDEDLKLIWKSDLLFEIQKLAKLMHNFGLMYQIAGSKNYVVPAYLPTEQPYDCWPEDGNPDTLHFKYQFDKYMPLGLMSRLIVALHKHIKNHDLVWSRGVNIEWKGAKAEIVETYGAENAFDVRIVGANKEQLLYTIREKFTQVLEPFRNLNYEQLVPCNCEKCTVANVPAFHNYNMLLELREARAGSQCSRSYKLIDVEGLLRVTEHGKERGDFGLRQAPLKESKSIPVVPKKRKWYKTLWGGAVAIVSGIGFIIGVFAGIAAIMDSEWVKNRFNAEIPSVEAAQPDAVVDLKADSLEVEPDSLHSRDSTNAP